MLFFHKVVNFFATFLVPLKFLECFICYPFGICYFKSKSVAVGQLLVVNFLTSNWFPAFFRIFSMLFLHIAIHYLFSCQFSSFSCFRYFRMPLTSQTLPLSIIQNFCSVCKVRWVQCWLWNKNAFLEVIQFFMSSGHTLCIEHHY